MKVQFPVVIGRVPSPPVHQNGTVNRSLYNSSLPQIMPIPIQPYTRGPPSPPSYKVTIATGNPHINNDNQLSFGSFQDIPLNTFSGSGSDGPLQETTATISTQTRHFTVVAEVHHRASHDQLQHPDQGQMSHSAESQPLSSNRIHLTSVWV